MSVSSATRVQLARMTEEHLEATRRWMQDPQLRQQIDSLGVPGEGHAEYWRARWEDGTQEVFAILDEHGEHVGNCGLQAIDRQRRKAELWIYLGEKRGQGLGTASVRQLLA